MRPCRIDRAESGNRLLVGIIAGMVGTFRAAGIAQLVEQLICNQQVIGSNPIAGSGCNSLSVWLAPDLKRRW
jgi:hypothetical protein